MSEQTAQKERYMVGASELEEGNGALIFTFVPKGLQQERAHGLAPKRVPEFIVTVRQAAGGLVYDWNGTADDPGAAREEMEAEAAVRMRDRQTWIDRVSGLVGQVEQWAREAGWSTRRLDKTLEDSRIGTHRVPALLMQQDLCRILLEPIGRSTPGAEGVVDLYLMPAYDDIANLYYYDNRWNLHYNTYRGTNAVVPVPKADAMPLSKETLEKVLVELRQNAA